MMASYALRPEWTPLNLLLMVVGFIVFWPLGLIMLAYILWGDRVPEIRRHFQSNGETRREQHGFRGFSCRSGDYGFKASGNAAFDEYRADELQRLEEERRKLDEELKQFESYMRDLRRARDKEEFDRFMRERSDRTHDGSTINL